MGNHERTEIVNLDGQRKRILKMRKELLARHRKECGMDGCTCGIKRSGLPKIP